MRRYPLGARAKVSQTHDVTRTEFAFLKKKFSAPPRTLFIDNAFDNSFVEQAIVNDVTLATFADVARFMTSAIPDGSGPTLTEWMKFLSVKGLASYEILEIVRERQTRKVLQ